MKRLFLIAIMALATTFAMAQEGEAATANRSTAANTPTAANTSTTVKAKSKSNYISVSFDLRGGGALAKDYREFGNLDIDVSFGYHFNDRWSIHLPLTTSLGLFYKTNTFTEQLYLGLGGEFKALEREDWNLIIAPKVQSTLGNRWGAMAYDLGVKSEWVGTPIVLGLGVRFIDTYASQISDKFLFYGSVGLRFNSPK
ncbi:MAG: hypothetical protein J6Q95_05450 [Alistipes sp.]|nr:hypothetical protein [Alistipes sp.]